MTRTDRCRLVAIAAIVTVATLTVSAQSPGRWLTQQKFAPVPAPEAVFEGATDEHPLKPSREKAVPKQTSLWKVNARWTKTGYSMGTKRN